MTKTQELRPLPLASIEEELHLAICREQLAHGSENTVSFADGMARVFGPLHQDVRLSFKERSTLC